jgi:chromosomal replication initiation ATPase DnaA
MNTDNIIRTVSEVLDCSIEEIRSGCRRRNVVAARRIIANLVPGTLCEIGRVVHRDHSSVHYYKRGFKDNLLYDKFLRDAMGEIMKRAETLRAASLRGD